MVWTSLSGGGVSFYIPETIYHTLAMDRKENEVQMSSSPKVYVYFRESLRNSISDSLH